MNTQVLKTARSELGLTVLATASMLGVDIETLQRWEHGTQNPNPANRAKVMDVLGV